MFLHLKKRNVNVLIDDDVWKEWFDKQGYDKDDYMAEYREQSLRECITDNMQYKTNEGLSLEDYCSGCGYPKKESVCGAYAHKYSWTRCYHIKNV